MREAHAGKQAAIRLAEGRRRLAAYLRARGLRLRPGVSGVTDVLALRLIYGETRYTARRQEPASVELVTLRRGLSMPRRPNDAHRSSAPSRIGDEPPPCHAPVTDVALSHFPQKATCLAAARRHGRLRLASHASVSSRSRRTSCIDKDRKDFSLGAPIMLRPGREDCECVLVPSGALVRLVSVLFARDSVRG